MGNNHKTKRVHVDKLGHKNDVYTSGFYQNDFHLKDGTPVKISETSNKNNIGSNKCNDNNIGNDTPTGFDWSDFAHTSEDL